MNGNEHMSKSTNQDTQQSMLHNNTIELDLTVNSVTNGVADFTLEGKEPKDKPHVNNKEIKIPKSMRDVILEYHLQDRSGNQLEFCKAKPIWVTRSADCPANECDDPQINVVKTQNHRLTLKDANSVTVTLRYSLVLEGDCGRALADPIIRNEA